MLHPNRHSSAPAALVAQRHAGEYLLLAILIAALVVFIAGRLGLGQPWAPSRPVEAPPFHLVAAGFTIVAGQTGGER